MPEAPPAPDLTVTSAPFTALTPEEIEALGAERAALWSQDRAIFSPQVFRAHHTDGSLAAATLVSARRDTAYRKIVDLWAAPESAAALAPLLDAVWEEQPPGALALKLEERPDLHAFSPETRTNLEARGFRADPHPMPSVESTLGSVRGWARWVGREPRAPITYYGQTTDVTCGAVTALMALDTDGAKLLALDDQPRNRSVEIELWRTATNLPAVEPVALAVTTARAAAERGVPFALPKVYLSAPSPVLLEWYDGDEYRLRADLQTESLAQADALGIEIVREWISVEQVADHVRAGDYVFLLIDLAPMIDDPTPHWVLAHDVIDDCLIIDDPWVERTHGETWVDTHHLPVPFAAVDEMTRWGSPEAYRGVVIVGRGADAQNPVRPPRAARSTA